MSIVIVDAESHRDLLKFSKNIKEKLRHDIDSNVLQDMYGAFGDAVTELVLIDRVSKSFIASGQAAAAAERARFLVQTHGIDAMDRWPGTPILLKGVRRVALGRLIGFYGTAKDLGAIFEALTLGIQLFLQKVEEIDIHLKLREKGLPHDEALVRKYLYLLEPIENDLRTARAIPNLMDDIQKSRSDLGSILKKIEDEIKKAQRPSPKPVRLKDIHSPLKDTEAWCSEISSLEDLEKGNAKEGGKRAVAAERADVTMTDVMLQCVERIGNNAANLADSFSVTVGQAGYNLTSATGKSLLAQGTSDAAEALAETTLGDPGKAGRSSASSAMLAGTGAGIMGVAEGFKSLAAAAKGGVFGTSTPVLMGEAGREVVMSAGEIGRSAQPSMAIGTWVDILPEPTTQASRFPESRALRFARLEQEAKRREGRPYGD
jgi:hypothetical protein